MKELDTAKVALIVGVFMGLMHLVWAMLVAFGLADTYLNFVFSLHFLNNPFTVTAFNMGTTVMLVVFTFVVGLVLGWVFAFIWNYLIKGKK